MPELITTTAANATAEGAVEAKEAATALVGTTTDAPQAGSGFRFPTERASLIILLGKQGSGKTHFLKSLLYDLFKAGHFKWCRAYVRTKFNKDFAFLPDAAVRTDFSLDKIEEYLSKLGKWRDANKGAALPHNVLLLDDMLGLVNHNDKRWVNLLANLRHYSMTIICTSQYFAAGCATTQMRNQADLALMWECRFARSRKAYWEAFGTYFGHQDEFEQVLDQATKERYTALVYNAYARDPAEMYFSYKAPELPEFTIKFQPL